MQIINEILFYLLGYSKHFQEYLMQKETLKIFTERIGKGINLLVIYNVT